MVAMQLSEKGLFMNGENNSNQHSAETVNQVTEQGIKASRFSRRRFLTTSAAASPVLFAVKSPMAWGSGGVGANGSIMCSGNGSDAGNCKKSVSLTPNKWKSVLQCGVGDKYYPLKNALEKASIYPNTKCIELLFDSVLSLPNFRYYEKRL